MKCPYCNHENPEGAMYCGRCGKRLIGPDLAGADTAAPKGDDAAAAKIHDAADPKEDHPDGGKPSKKKSPVRILIAAAGVIAVIALVFLVSGISGGNNGNGSVSGDAGDDGLVSGDASGDGSAGGGAGSGSLSGFSADEIYFAAGQEDTITFTVSSDAEPESVTLYQDDTAVAEMSDVGEGGDETAGDGIYTASVSLLQDTAAQLVYSCSDGASISETIVVYVFADPTDGSWDEMDEVESALEEIEFGYTDESGYVPADSVQDVISEVAAYAQDLLNGGILIDYEVNDDNVLFKFASGLSMVYEPNTGETDSGGDGVSMTVITCQPCLSGYSSDPVSFMGLPDEAAATIAETFDNYTYSEETNYDDEEVSLSLIRSFGSNEIVLWHGHGGYSDSLHSYLRTGDDYSYWYADYWADYVQDRIIESSSTGKACITAAFIDKYCADLDNSLFYLAACHSGQDSVLADSFLNKGAAAAVGMSESILTEYDLRMMHAVMTYMTRINSATVNYYTLSEAVDAAMGYYGATDTDYAASGLYSGSSSGKGAYLIIFGGTDTNEYRLGEADETVLMYQLYDDKLTELQETYGEAQLERMDETVTFDAGDGYLLYTYYWTGLFFAHLADMDGDGTEELITGYYDSEKVDTSGGYSLLTTGYTIDIWVYADGGLQGYSLEPSQIGWSAEEGYIECQIGLTDDAAYVISEDESADLTRYEYYGLIDGTVKQIHSYDVSSGSLTVDGQEYGSYEDAMAMVGEWLAELTDTQYWCFGGQYVLQEDISYFEKGYEAEMAPAEEELKSTLSALAEHLSSASEEANEGDAQGDAQNETQNTGNLPDEAAFAEAVNGENVLYYLAADYDGDGVQEAYGITGDEPDDFGYSNNDSIFFISSDGTITCVMSDTYGYLSTADTLIEAGDQQFMVWNVSGGSSAVSYIFGVQDGAYYEPAISGNYERFTAYDDGYAALTADWSDGWHDYDVNLFEYDGSGEFTLLYTRDYDYDTDTVF